MPAGSSPQFRSRRSLDGMSPRRNWPWVSPAPRRSASPNTSWPRRAAEAQRAQAGRAGQSQRGRILARGEGVPGGDCGKMLCGLVTRGTGPPLSYVQQFGGSESRPRVVGGTTVQYRLNRGVDRRLNSALHMATVTRMTHGAKSRRVPKPATLSCKAAPKAKPTKKFNVESSYRARRIFRILATAARAKIVQEASCQTIEASLSHYKRPGVSAPARTSPKVRPGSLRAWVSGIRSFRGADSRSAVSQKSRVPKQKALSPDSMRPEIPLNMGRIHVTHFNRKRYIPLSIIMSA